MKNREKPTYLKESRLADVIRLLAVLGVHKKWSFRSDDGLDDALNGKPKSADSWFDIAKEHPEFFKFNKENSSIVLLLRFLNQPVVKDNEIREALSIDQTQKMIDQAIALHDKQLARYQRDSFKMPIISATITSLVSLIAVFSNIYLTNSNNNKINSDLNTINTKLEEIDSSIKSNTFRSDTLQPKLKNK